MCNQSKLAYLRQGVVHYITKYDFVNYKQVHLRKGLFTLRS